MSRPNPEARRSDSDIPNKPGSLFRINFVLQLRKAEVKLLGIRGIDICTALFAFVLDRWAHFFVNAPVTEPVL